jgi:glycosyltransferase involved in cell wall biosynthesis
MIRACFLIKYPPIEGGVSMRGYWMARGLAERGHQIYVITNANEVEDEYRMFMDKDDEDWYEPRFEDSGGFVKVRHSTPLSDAMMHIPQANPFVAKLSSIATQVVRRRGCDVIFAHYLQPYGLAAYLTSLWTGVPFMVKHAGSDLGRLMKQRDLSTAYREVLKAADCVWAGLSDKEPFLAMGVKEERIWQNRPSRVPPIFNPEAEPLDLNRLLARLAAIESDHIRNLLVNTTPIDMSRPTIGIYGKVGEVKGSFDLLAALGMLKRKGLDFNLVALTQGRALEGFKRAIAENSLQDRVWVLPFIPHWKMPRFIRACTAVCFLERDFPISFHGPTVPKEVLACGTCLILSGEIADKQPVLKKRFIDGENLLIVDDPKEHIDLAARLSLVIEAPDRARAIGREGYRIYGEPEYQSAVGRKIIRTSIEAFEQRLIETRDARNPATSVEALSADDIVDRRKSLLKERLPHISLLWDGKWERLVDEYCRRHSALEENRFQDALRFCEFIEPEIAELSAKLPYARDVLKYERNRNLLYVELQTDAAQGGSISQGAVKIAFGDSPRRNRFGRRPFMLGRNLDEMWRLVPIKLKGVHVETFDYDVRRLKDCFQQNEIPDDLPKEESYILFKRELNFVGFELEINEATKHLLDLCDGSRSVEAIYKEMARHFLAKSDSDWTEESLRRDMPTVIRELITRGVIRLSSEGETSR